MSIIKHLKRMQYIDFMIRRKATGNLKSFAEKNKLSIRGLTQVLLEMKESGFPIKFCRKRNSYYYEEDGEMVKCLFIRKGTLEGKNDFDVNLTKDPQNVCFSKVKIFEICGNK